MKKMMTYLSVLVMVIGLSVAAHATLVDMHDGTIYSTNTQLSWLKDVAAGGLKTWDQAVAWAASLNADGGFASLTGWRLPNVDPACGFNSNCTNSEIGYLYYTELGNKAGGPLTDTGPFTNLQAFNCWAVTEAAPNPDLAWSFYVGGGLQGVSCKVNGGYAWAVRPGMRSQ